MDKKKNLVLDDLTNAGKAVAKLPVNKLVKGIGNYIILALVGIALFIVAWFGGGRLFGWLFQSTSPFSQQRQDIAVKNNVRDAYSSIIGSDVSLISQNGIIKWFNNKEAKEIDISIPKLINYSSLFDDDTHRNDLKDAFSQSINKENINQSSFKYKIDYDGATINNNGQNYRDVTSENEKSMTEDLKRRVKNQEHIEFKEWNKVGKNNNVDFKSKGEDRVKVDGYFSTGFWPLKKTYHLTSEYKYSTGHYVLVENSLKVEKIKS